MLGRFSRPRASLALLAVCASGALASGCLTYGRERGTESIQETGPITRIEVDLDAGNVTITSAGPSEGAHGAVESRWSEGVPEVLHYVQDGVLHILGRCDTFALTCRTDVTLEVGASVSVGVSTGQGAMAVSGVNGDVEGATNDGPIDLQDLGGVVFVETGNGDISGDGLTGTVIDARTASGTVELHLLNRPERLVARTEGGDVNLLVPAGPYRIQAAAPSGDLVLGALLQDDATSASVIVARTQNGNIRMEGERPGQGGLPPVPQ
ncbi:MAG: DUF4097 family beta strand repeat-containing protein [Pseudomonadota bacterium]|nr:DUF4097 family beta strand repeat-containing protein [Pseudomonadota bacterium]